MPRRAPRPATPALRLTRARVLWRIHTRRRNYRLAADMNAPTVRKGLELSKIALQVATEASRLVLSGFRQSPKVSFKDGQEPYTDFDVESERLVRQRLG